MAYLPVNARSELVMPSNWGDGGVCDTTRRFQAASPGFRRPALSPTRGSCEGGVAEVVTAGAGAPPASVEELDPAQAAVRATRVTRAEERITGGLTEVEGRRASSPCGRS